MSPEVDRIAWPAERLGDAMEALAAGAGLSPRAVAPPLAPAIAIADRGALSRWLDQAASHLGVEAEPVQASLGEATSVVLASGPALLCLPGDGPLRFIALVGRAGRDVAVLRPDRAAVRVPAEALADLLCGTHEERLRPELASLLDSAGVAPRRRPRARRALLRERLGAVPIQGVWTLRSLPGASPRRQFAEAGLPRRAVVVVAAQVATSALLALAWWVIAEAALADRIDGGWMLAWALLLVTAVPVRLVSSWAAGIFALDAGALIKRRLLAGVLELDPDEVRHEGAGAFLGRVIESEAVESLALGAGIAGITATVSLVLGGALLAGGAGGALHVLVLAAWTGVSLLLVGRYYALRRRWTETRRAMTTDLVERMGGHRTRLAQEPAERWHDGEDQALARYAVESAALDRNQASLSALLPRGWLVVGVLGLVPAFVAGSAGTTAIAVSLAGILLAGSALQGLIGAVSNLAGAAVAWRQVAALFAAAARAEAAPAPVLRPTQGAAASTVLEAHHLVFRHGHQGEPVLRGADLRIARGDRLLLEGPSGGGKSTLCSLLGGLRAPESGLLLLHGLDRRSLGAAAWRRCVASAPQFHENHILQSTLAFNLLMGRGWPPTPADLAEADTICRELGLGELLERMPGGLMQLVGETGWQLSHGEKSRIYIARALLQGADVLLLDESFGALDPDTLGASLRAVLGRAPTVLVIAHP